MFPSLEVFYSYYGSYHTNTVNKLIHIVCIPLILISALTLINYISFEYYISDIYVNFSLIFIIILSRVYIRIDRISGIISGLLYIGFTFLVNKYYQKADEDQRHSLFYLALQVHIICWIAQFIGHGIFEKRAPALFDNILQVFIAPDFVILEILFHFGYKQEIYKKAQTIINNNVQKFKQSKVE